MSTTDIRLDAASGTADVTHVEMKVEVIVIPVADVDQAKEFYARLGWRLDRRRPAVVPFTPPGSACSIQFGVPLTAAAPGSGKGYLVVSDLQATRRALVAASVEVSAVFHLGPDGPLDGPDPDHRSYCFSRATFSDPAARPGRGRRHVVRVGQRPGERVPARGGRPRRAREAHGEADPDWPDWPDWYAAYMVAEQAGTELPK